MTLRPIVKCSWKALCMSSRCIIVRILDVGKSERSRRPAVEISPRHVATPHMSRMPKAQITVIRHHRVRTLEQAKGLALLDIVPEAWLGPSWLLTLLARPQDVYLFSSPLL